MFLLQGKLSPKDEKIQWTNKVLGKPGRGWGCEGDRVVRPFKYCGFFASSFIVHRNI
jgi:hypothetical protein